MVFVCMIRSYGKTPDDSVLQSPRAIGVSR